MMASIDSMSGIQLPSCFFLYVSRRSLDVLTTHSMMHVDVQFGGSEAELGSYLSS